jgi:cytidine deaminase
MSRRRNGAGRRVALSGVLLSRAMCAARDAARHAYAPYSRFRVGAAVVARGGKVFGGSNVENASYGLTLCAERSAVGAAVAAGERELRAVVIQGPRQTFTPPCGACRQVLVEFNPRLEVILVNRSGRVCRRWLDRLLPGAFSLGRGS